MNVLAGFIICSFFTVCVAFMLDAVAGATYRSKYWKVAMYAYVSIATLLIGAAWMLLIYYAVYM